MAQQIVLGSPQVSGGVCDYDKENGDDISEVSHYATDIIKYLKSRETLFMPEDYLSRHTSLTKSVRSVLVDWIIQTQEDFDYSFETIYMGVKLLDLYFSQIVVSTDKLVLVAVAAMVVATKYDERPPKLVKKFDYLCDGAYRKKDLVQMELSLLKICNFSLGIPLSYTFLLRCTRCAKIPAPIETLASFILEFSLMDYETISIVGSKLAAASLYLALRMKNFSGWTPTLEFYTGYKLEEIIDVVHLMNNYLHLEPEKDLMTVKNKYSHKRFFQVAKTPLLKNEDLK